MKKSKFWPMMGLLGIRMGWEWLIDASDRKMAAQEKLAQAEREVLLRSAEVVQQIKDRGDMVAANTIRSWMDTRGVVHCAVCLSTDQLKKRGPILLCPTHRGQLDDATAEQLQDDMLAYGSAYVRPPTKPGGPIERVAPAEIRGMNSVSPGPIGPRPTVQPVPQGRKP